MRTESVVCRPFFKLPSELSSAIERIAIQFQPDEDFEQGPSIKVGCTPQEASLVLRFDEALPPFPDEELRARTRLVVALWDESRRETRVLDDMPVTELRAPADLPIRTSNLSIGWLGSRGAVLSTYLILNEDRDFGLGLPSRRAHILAMKHFSINKAGPGAELPVEFWTGKDFQSLGLPESTTVAVVGDPESFAADTVDDLNIRIAINEALRGAFAHARRSKRANVLQDAIRTDAVVQMIKMVLESGIEDFPEGTPAFRLVNQVARANKRAPKDLKGWSDTQVHAFSQTFCGLTEAGKQVN